jgi:hypothetical protein
MRVGDLIQRKPEHRTGGWNKQFFKNPARCIKVEKLGPYVKNDMDQIGLWNADYFIIKPKYYIERLRCSLK